MYYHIIRICPKHLFSSTSSCCTPISFWPRIRPSLPWNFAKLSKKHAGRSCAVQGFPPKQPQCSQLASSTFLKQVNPEMSKSFHFFRSYEQPVLAGHLLWRTNLSLTKDGNPPLTLLTGRKALLRRCSTEPGRWLTFALAQTLQHSSFYHVLPSSRAIETLVRLHDFCCNHRGWTGISLQMFSAQQ